MGRLQDHQHGRNSGGSTSRIAKIVVSCFNSSHYQGVGFPFLSYLWQPDIEIHHVREVREPKVMGQFLAGLQINRGREREVLLSQVNALLFYLLLRIYNFYLDYTFKRQLLCF